tara:strand:+ start:109 stop:399 length:291 start_codon:yes stop_codon:yes gene_type:complete
MKDNKLIAEFMGYRVFGNKCRKPMPYSLKGWLVDDISPMQFHTEWNWLMPVLRKIYTMFGYDYHEAIYELDNAVLSFDMNRTYKAVVEFLKNNKIA